MPSSEPPRGGSGAPGGEAPGRRVQGEAATPGTQDRADRTAGGGAAEMSRRSARPAGFAGRGGSRRGGVLSRGARRRLRSVGIPGRAPRYRACARRAWARGRAGRGFQPRVRGLRDALPVVLRRASVSRLSRLVSLAAQGLGAAALVLGVYWAALGSQRSEDLARKRVRLEQAQTEARMLEVV